jgi:hypothetical protein
MLAFRFQVSTLSPRSLPGFLVFICKHVPRPFKHSSPCAAAEGVSGGYKLQRRSRENRGGLSKWLCGS